MFQERSHGGDGTDQHLPGSLQAVSGAVGTAVGQIPPAFHTDLPVPLQPAAPGVPAAPGPHLGQAEIAAGAGEGEHERRKEGKWWSEGRAEIGVGC